MALQHLHGKVFLAVLPVPVSAIPIPFPGQGGADRAGRRVRGCFFFALSLPPVPCAIRLLACHFNLSASPECYLVSHKEVPCVLAEDVL